MLTIKKLVPSLLLCLMALSSSDCEQESRTEAEFIDQEILTTEMNIRVNGLQDLLYFATLQELNACQEDCAKIKEAVAAAEKEVAAMESLLVERIGGVKPPPPPCPCETGNCLWESPALFTYFVDVKKYSRLPDVTVQTLNGEVISSSKDAKVDYSPEGGQFAVVDLPPQSIKEKAVKIVISNGGDGAAELLVNIK